jgi:2-isopropylmalate synthase (EC 2.3.3.13)
MGVELESDEEFQHLFERFKDLCDRKKRVDDRDILALVTGEMQHTPEIYKLDHVQYSSGVNMIPTATVRLIGPDGTVHVDSDQGTGPVDAIYKAINRVIQRPNELMEFSINAITEGLDAVAEVTVRIREQGAPSKAENGERIGASSSTVASLTGKRVAQQIFSG